MDRISWPAGSSWQTVTSYNGVMTTWTNQNFDITSYANSSSQMKIRFSLKSDPGVVADGWYLDDIKILNYNPVINSIVTDLDLTICLLYTSPSPRDRTRSRMPSSA